MTQSFSAEKNLVLERQKAYQHSHKPIYYRPPRSGLYLGLYKSGFALGVAGIAYSAYSLVKGKN